MSDIDQQFEKLQETVRAGLRRDHPDWSDETIRSYETRFEMLLRNFIPRDANGTSSPRAKLFDTHAG
jgi:hypothetical protein